MEMNVPRPLSPRKRIYQKASQNKIPISGTFELTPLCNMNCRMCYIRMTPEEMRARGTALSAEDWIRFGRECLDAGMLYLLLTGGEPTLRPDFPQIYQSLCEMGLVVSINTNGTLLSAEILDLFRRYCPARVNVTLYGGSNETYASLCGNPRGFDQATAGIRALVELGIPVVINASFTKLNMEDMDQIYAFARELRLTVRPTTYMFPPIRNAKDGIPDEESRLSPEDAGKALYRTKVCSLSPGALAGLRWRVQKGMPLDCPEDDCGGGTEEHMSCMAGKCAFWVTWDGRMLPCGMMNEPVVYPFQQGFKDCWREIVDKTQQILLPPQCGSCKLRAACTVCGAAALAEGCGDSTKKPEYICRMIESYIRCCY